MDINALSTILQTVHFNTIVNSIQNYIRHAKVYVDLLEVDDDSITIRIEQKELVNSKLLTQKELIDRGKNIFQDISNDYKINVRALTYKGGLHKEMTVQYIKDEMEKRNLKLAHLVLYLGIDKSMLSKVLNKDTPLTGFQKAAFHYLFKWMDEASK